MATVCPCGCWRRIEFSTHVPAVGVVRMDAMLAVVRPFVEPGVAGAGGDAVTAAGLRTTVANGEQIRRWFLEHVHGDARAGVTPDVLTLTRRMNQFAATVRDLLAPVPA